MKKILYIFIIVVASLAWGCKDYDIVELESDSSATSSCVEVLADGRLLVSGSFSTSSFYDVSVSTRASINDIEYNVLTGWCLIFGEYPDETSYSENSPLLEVVPLTIDATGKFTATLIPYDDTAFVRFVVNLTERETANIKSAVAWADQDDAYDSDSGIMTAPTIAQITEIGIANFGHYIEQSVGLDAIYNVSYESYNEAMGQYDKNTSLTLDPNPTTENGHLATSFPMSSVGYVLEAINETEVQSVFEKSIYLIRTCSKVEVNNNTPDTDEDRFELSEVYMIECAQEARIRSTVLNTTGTTGNETSTDLGIPYDLGGNIDYVALKETVASGETTSPIYIFPNSGTVDGSDSQYNADDWNDNLNPQYIILKGRAAGYDTDGYYKIALKAQYPLTYKYDSSGDLLVENDSYVVDTWSDVTYDILRNTYFKVNLTTVDKPGYKTFEDAAKSTNPASNISYSITVMSGDSRNEILVSNGTYYVELQTTRVYMSGYGTAGNRGSIKFTVTPNYDLGSSHPAIYVMSDFSVDVESCYADGSAVDKTTLATGDDGYDTSDDVDDYWYKIQNSDSATSVVVNYAAEGGGRIRLRIGDMLKFIPVYYDNATLFDQDTESVEIGDEDDFAYDDITYFELDNSDGSTLYDKETTSIDATWFSDDGKITTPTTADDASREMRAMIYPKSGSGVTKLYFRQTYTKTEVINPADKTYAEANFLFDGNVIELGGSYTTDTPDGYDSSDADEIAGQLMADMITDGYTSIYIEGNASANDGLDFADVMKEMVDTLDALGETESAKYYGTITIDLSDITGVYSVFGEENKESASYFVDNPYIDTVVLPGSILEKIDENAFVDCENLTTVIVGSLSDQTVEFDTIEEDAFNGCGKLEIVLVYTTNNKNQVLMKSQSGSSYFTADSKTESTTATSKALTNNGSANKNARFTLTNTSGFLHMFYGVFTDYVDDSNKILEKYYNAQYTE